MDHPTALLDNLHSLVIALDDSDIAVADALVELTGDLVAGIASYRGLQVTLIHHGYPVVLTAFTEILPGDGPELRTSLRLPLWLLGAHFEVGSRVVFYAGVAGALVELADHVREVLTAGTTEMAPPEPGTSGSPVGLDIDLPPSTMAYGLTGLTELSTINRAIGLLIDSGHQLDEVHDTLRRQARLAGLAPHVFAARLLET